MKQVLIFAFCITLLVACSRSGYEISGTVNKSDLNGKYVYLYEYGAGLKNPTDSALVENGVFKMEGTATTPKLFVLEFKAEDVPSQSPSAGVNNPYTAVFILENGKLKADFTEKPSVTGTPENDSWAASQKKISELRSNMNQLIEEMRSGDENIRSVAEKKYEEISRQLTDMVKEYIQVNSLKQSAAKLLYDFRYYLDEDFKREIVGKAGEAFLAVPHVDEIVKHLAILEKVAVGKAFTDFTLNDPSGKSVKLSDYAGKGKVTLVDFWASWCGPCRADMPHLVNVYDQYKNKGFEIVGVSLDRTNDEWVKGIDDLKITWPQMSDLKFWQSEGAALYGVNSIPHTVLLDKEGIIIAKNLRGEALDRKLEEVLK